MSARGIEESVSILHRSQRVKLNCGMCIHEARVSKDMRAPSFSWEKRAFNSSNTIGPILLKFHSVILCALYLKGFIRQVVDNWNKLLRLI